MAEIKTARRGAGQARTRQRVSRRAKTIALYVCLTVGGILLFRAGAAYALQQRGYIAVGGEVFALLLPLIYYAISSTVRDIIADVKNGFQPNFEEENDNEETF